MTLVDCEYLIIGAGIAGVSVGFWLAPHGRTVVLEAAAQPAYHATGRSAAMIIDSYGPAQVRALSLVSREFFQRPPARFADTALLRRRGALVLGRHGQEDLLDAHWSVVRTVSPQAVRLSPREVVQLVPVVREDLLVGGVLEPEAADIDVHALHQGYLRGIREHGGQIRCDTTVTRAERIDGRWVLEASGARYRAAVLVNAAGAWCDEIARLAGVSPIGLVPKRRTAFIFAPPQDVVTDEWPLCAAADWSWYMKPDAGRLLGSPANEDPVAPQDVQPEDMDIVLGIDAIERMTTLEIRRPMSAWAGLRSFVADGNLVGGFDGEVPGFFWIAGQGGYGVQTSAAMGEACASLLRDRGIPGHIASCGVTEATLGPSRLLAHGEVA
jgi:D-arginine dehydrogenase